MHRGFCHVYVDASSEIGGDRLCHLQHDGRGDVPRGSQEAMAAQSTHTNRHTHTGRGIMRTRHRLPSSICLDLRLDVAATVATPSFLEAGVPEAGGDAVTTQPVTGVGTRHAPGGGAPAALWYWLHQPNRNGSNCSL